MEDYVLFTVAKIDIDHKPVMAGGGLLPPYSLRISVFEGFLLEMDRMSVDGICPTWTSDG